MSAFGLRRAQSVAGTGDRPLTVIGPWKPGVFPRFAEIWRARRVLPFIWREFVFKRYRGTYLGIWWLPIRPLIGLLSGGLFFGQILQVPSGDRPYIITIAFSMSGWIIFDSTLRWGARALRRGKSITSGLYFPGAAIMTGVVGPVFFDWLIQSAVAIFAVLYFVIVQGHYYLALPQQMVVGVIGWVILLIFGIGVSLVTAPITLITKEVRYLIGYGVTFLQIVTPVYYDSNHIPAKYKSIIELNPLTAPIELVKYGFLDTGFPSSVSLLSSAVGLVIAVFGGLAFFARMEKAAVERL